MFLLTKLVENLLVYIFNDRRVNVLLVSLREQVDDLAELSGPSSSLIFSSYSFIFYFFIKLLSSTELL